MNWTGVPMSVAPSGLAQPCQNHRVIAIVGGLGAAVSWAVATLCSSRSSRMIGASSVLAWVMIVGFSVAIVPAILEAPTAAPLNPTVAVGLFVVGLSYTTGLLLAYLALTVGRVSIVAPITSTEGAISAIVAVATGIGILQRRAWSWPVGLASSTGFGPIVLLIAPLPSSVVASGFVLFIALTLALLALAESYREA